MRAEATAPPAFARVVVDTNVLLSAALSPSGLPARLLDWWLRHSRLVFSRATFSELQTRVWKPKFDRYLGIELRQRLLHDLDAIALWVEIPSEVSAQRWSRDRDDDAFVHAAQVAGASRLITGDDDLLVLGQVGQVAILSPRQAWDALKAAGATLR